MTSFGDSTSAPVRILPESVVRQIAAGEVIERPASVVKELVENALDAGARHIRVDIRSGGLELIRVRDDGAGIEPGQLELACHWHATSKLPHDDISRVGTLGFRGEALPSIALIADLELTSRAASNAVGREFRPGRVPAVERPAPHPIGTTATVRDLFAHHPARLAAVAPTQSELARIGQMLRRLALASPRVAFSCWTENRELLQTSGSGDLGQTMVEVYGDDLLDRLVELDAREVFGARLSGLVAGPEITRPSRSHLNIIVNGRWVQPRGLISAVENAYRTVLPRGRHPVATLRIDVDSAAVNVNVHPTKLDVRLLEEHSIAKELGEMMRKALGRRAVEPRGAIAMGLAALDVLGVREERDVYDDVEPVRTTFLPPLTLVGQLRNTLLVTETGSGLLLVDQHRAHERVLFDFMLKEHAARPSVTSLAEPIVLELGAAQARRLARRGEDLERLGFSCEEFGGRSFLVRAAPALPGVLDPQGPDELAGLGEPGQLREALLASLEEDESADDGWQQRLLVSISCRTAVRRGRPLDRAAMRALLRALGECQSPAVCPHGSPLLMQLSDRLLQRQFGW